MTNQEAREILVGLEAAYRDLNPLALTDEGIRLVNERIEAVRVAISALQEQDVPDTNVRDTISRQAAIDAVNSHFGFSVEEEYGSAVQEVLNALPSTQPERKKGHWLHEKNISSNSERGFFLLPACTCSECNIMIAHEANYCPNCGADMRGEENGRFNQPAGGY